MMEDVFVLMEDKRNGRKRSVQLWGRFFIAFVDKR